MSLKWGNKERWITEPKLKWSSKFSEKELKYFTKKIPVAERTDDAIVWFILAMVSLCGIGYWVWVVVR
uniref:Uncharacterized protein n=1 Tax=viral metagenome TaxID=1070528 RepID=A0A6M3XHY0_9ZZZZ